MRTYRIPTGRAAGLAAALALAWAVAAGAHAQPAPAPGVGAERGDPLVKEALLSAGYPAQDPAANKVPSFAQEMNAHYLAVIRDPADGALGATLEPVGDPLRAQLGLAKEEGLVVAALAGDGPAAQAGLKEKDILLRLEGRPLGKADDLPRRLKELGEKDLNLDVLRGGKPLALKVRPVYRVTLGPTGKESTSYFLGVSAEPVDDTLRAHLALPERQGLVLSAVVADSPAARAGLKPHDVLVRVGRTPLTTTEDLVKAVQETKGEATPVTFVREGKTKVVDVTPERRTSRTEPAGDSVRLWLLGQQAHPQWYGRPQAYPPLHFAAPPDALNRRIDALDQELKSLRQAVEELSRALKERRGRD